MAFVESLASLVEAKWLKVHESAWEAMVSISESACMSATHCEIAMWWPHMFSWLLELKLAPSTMQLLPIFGPWSQSSQHKRSWTQHQCRLQIRPNCVQTIWISLSIIIPATYTNGSDLFGERYKLSFESFPEASVSQIQSSQLVHMKFIHPNHPNLSVGSLFFSVAALSTWRWATRRCQVEVAQSQAAKAHGAGSKSRSPGPLEVVTSKAGVDGASWISMISMICFSILEDFVDGFLGRFFLQRATTGWRDQLATEKPTPNKTFSIVKVPLVPLTSTHPNKNLQSPMPPSHPVTSTAWHMEAHGSSVAACETHSSQKMFPILGPKWVSPSLSLQQRTRCLANSSGDFQNIGISFILTGCPDLVPLRWRIVQAASGTPLSRPYRLVDCFILASIFLCFLET